VKILVLSTAFPSATRPTYGVFVGERVRYVARHADVLVVAPVPWAPFNRLVRGDAVADTPATEIQHGVPVEHPRFACTPLLGKAFDAALYAVSMVPVLARLRRRFPFDVIDAHFTYPDGVAAVLLGKVFRAPTFITVRGTHDIRHAGFGPRRAQIRWGLRNATGVIAVSDSLRQFAERLGIEAMASTPVASHQETWWRPALGSGFPATAPSFSRSAPSPRARAIIGWSKPFPSFSPVTLICCTSSWAAT
jgi:teichuronic acid biosynthesis glycosyltransferase TuaC